MRPFFPTSVCLLLLLCKPCLTSAGEPATTFQPLTQFTIPLSDGKLANAILTPQSNGHLMIIALPGGKLGLFSVSEIRGPQPTPTPVDPPQPTQNDVNLVTVSETTPATISGTVQTTLAAVHGSFFAYTLTMISDEHPPENALKWIGRTAGKTYPYSFLTDKAGVILWEGPTPTTDTNLASLITSGGQLPATPARCHGGTCPH